MNPFYATTLFQAEEPASGWPHAFAILTAHNRDGQTEDAGQNEKHDTGLIQQLEELQCWRWRIVGGSPDFRHAEPGWAIEVPLANALALGNLFKQEAIFWVDGDALSLVACDQTETQALGSWRDRLERGNRVSQGAKPIAVPPDESKRIP